MALIKVAHRICVNWRMYFRGGPGWESTMVPGSLSYEGDDEALGKMMLQVTVDGEAWYDNAHH